MTMLSAPDQPISTLTVSELEALITQIVRRVLREEMRQAAASENGGTLPEEFLATFGAWEDDRSTDEIVAEIYASRTVSTTETSL